MFIHPDNPNILYISAEGNEAGGKLYQIELQRDRNGRITGLTPYDSDGPLKDPFFEVPGIDGGLRIEFDGDGFDPANVTNVLWTTYDDNTFREFVRGTGVQVTNLGDLYDAKSYTDYNSTGGFTFAPGDAGETKIILSDHWTGSINLFTYTQPNDFLQLEFVRGYPKTLGDSILYSTGIMYIPPGTGPGFDDLTMLVFDWYGDRIVAYDVDGDGMPLTDSGRLFA